MGGEVIKLERGKRRPSGGPPTHGDWRDTIQWRKGFAASSIANAVTIFVHADEWRSLLAYNEFSQQVTKLKRPAWDAADAPRTSEGSEWTDVDDVRAACWLSRHWGINLGVHAIADAVAVAARHTSFHPVREYLNALTWDGQPRLATWLSRYLGAPGGTYESLVGTWWMISAVARVFQPGCKVDTVLILEGKQGLGKSSALKVLAGDWFLDTPFELANKDAFIVLRGHWIVELQELGALIRAEPARAKAYFSLSTDVYRSPHARRAAAHPRQCAFAGTVNHEGYLRDETGGRRYWPILCLRIDLDALARDRDQLWAEACAHYHEGRPWWPDSSSTSQLCATEQEKRHHADEWEAVIAKWLAGSKEPVTVGNVLENAIELDRAKWTRAEQMRVAACLVRLGRRRVQREIAGRRAWVYEVDATV